MIHNPEKLLLNRMSSSSQSLWYCTFLLKILLHLFELLHSSVRSDN